MSAENPFSKDMATFLAFGLAKKEKEQAERVEKERRDQRCREEHMQRFHTHFHDAMKQAMEKDLKKFQVELCSLDREQRETIKTWMGTFEGIDFRVASCMTGSRGEDTSDFLFVSIKD